MALNETLGAFKLFELSSGLTINCEKSILFPLGTYTRVMPVFVNDYNLKFSTGPVRMFGISGWFTHNGNDVFRLNYTLLSC